MGFLDLKNLIKALLFFLDIFMILFFNELLSIFLLLVERSFFNLFIFDLV